MLTEQQRTFWHQNGYLKFDNVLSPAEVENLRKSADALVAQAGGITESTDRYKLKFLGDSRGVAIQVVAEPHEMGGEWLALARHPRILDVAEELLGPNVQLYYSMMMMKPPLEGYEARWHQDLAHFVHNRACLLACQIYIDDSTLENGCLRIVPGSHKLGLLNHFSEDTFTGVVQGDTSAFDSREVALPMEAGGMLLWHSLTLHSSHANRSDRSRRAITFQYKNPEARLLTGSFSAKLEVRSVGLMVRGRDPQGELLTSF